MAEFAAPLPVGNDILDIGSRKARRQRGGFEPMAPPSALTLGRPAQFDVPNVSNVSDIIYVNGAVGSIC